MKCKILAFVAALVSFASLGLAQTIRFNLEMDHPSYVIGEHVGCKVSLGNLGAKPVVIGDFKAFEENRVFFEIYAKQGVFLEKVREGKIIRDMDLGRNEALAFEVDLSEWYALLHPGHFFVRAVLICNGRRYESPTRSFDIVPGIEMARLVQYIPGAPAVERTISLVYWNRGGRELAFLRASDSPTGVVWMTLFLGDVVRVRKASIQRDTDDPASFSVYRQATRDMLVRTIVQSDSHGMKILKQTRAVETVSSPMVDSIREAVENAPEE